MVGAQGHFSPVEHLSPGANVTAPTARYVPPTSRSPLSQEKQLLMPLQTFGKQLEKTEKSGKIQSFRISDILNRKDEECSSYPQTNPTSDQENQPVQNAQNECRKRRRSRTIFSESQLQELETAFQGHKYLSVQERRLLAHRMCLSEVQVKTWYQNRRTKWKREAAEYVWVPTPVYHPFLFGLLPPRTV